MNPLEDDMPHGKANCRDGSWWLVPPESCAGFLAAWKSGAPFWTGVGRLGDTVHIKLADITGFVERSEIGILRAKEEADEMKRREKAADVLGDA